MRAIGIMSGTSADGIDAILLELESVEARHTPKVLASVHTAYPTEVRRELVRPEALSLSRIAELHHELPLLYAEAVTALPDHGSAIVVGMHGQTVFHRPPSQNPRVPCTLQIGSTAVLAERIGLPVVGDMRSADLAWGGEGAPIVPFAHWFFTPPERAGTLVVNVGGIANVTHVAPRAEDVTAEDIGPGMMIVDALVSATTGGDASYDVDGRFSREGQVIPAIVARILAHPFFARPRPRTTGREDFGGEFVDALRAEFASASGSDLLRSAIEATALSIENAARERNATAVLLTGGGALNPTLVEAVGAHAAGRSVSVAEEGVFAPSHHEPAAMALIAARTWSGLPSNLPAVTGAARAVVLGHVCRPSWRVGDEALKDRTS